MEVEKGFIGQRLQQTVSELEDVREKMKSLTARLSEAENVLRFYGDPRNYAITAIVEDTSTYQDRLKKDSSQADNDPTTFVAGFRAREYFKQHGNW